MAKILFAPIKKKLTIGKCVRNAMEKKYINKNVKIVMARGVDGFVHARHAPEKNKLKLNVQGVSPKDFCLVQSAVTLIR